MNHGRRGKTRKESRELAKRLGADGHRAAVRFLKTHYCSRLFFRDFAYYQRLVSLLGAKILDGEFGELWGARLLGDLRGRDRGTQGTIHPRVATGRAFGQPLIRTRRASSRAAAEQPGCRVDSSGRFSQRCHRGCGTVLPSNVMSMTGTGTGVYGLGRVTSKPGTGTLKKGGIS